MHTEKSSSLKKFTIWSRIIQHYGSLCLTREFIPGDVELKKQSQSSTGIREDITDRRNKVARAGNEAAGVDS